MKQKLQSAGRVAWLAELSGNLDSAERQLAALGSRVSARDRLALQQRIGIARAELKRIDALTSPATVAELTPFWSKLLQESQERRPDAPKLPGA